ncbi:MAG: CotH kinase family protein [Bacteroidota bacterium]
MRYLKGKDAAGLTVNWINSSFDDSGWALGNAPIRYGDGTGGTVLDDMMNNYSVVYMRSRFTVENVALLDDIVLDIDYDDGFVIWINGQRALSENEPAILSYNAFAPGQHESGLADTFKLEPGSVVLVEGENTLAIQGFNISLESSDFLMNLGIHAGLIEPVLQDTVGLHFSEPSGFYDEPFYLDITPSNPDWDVVYTLDGSNPQYSETAIVRADMAHILIDPASTIGRPATPAVVVRASSVADGIKPSYPESRTYIFLDEVKDQGYPGGDWPTTNINGQLIDLPMDPRVVYDPAYMGEMDVALTDIPSISLITDLDNLFDPSTGIYVNAYGHGFEWERECSVELINPDESDGFSVNAGLRIRGGWSRHDDFPKHAFRLFFRSQYGDAKLNYPLFGDEGVDRFDKIDLRTSQNYSWARYADRRNTFLREVFSRDLQRDMGQPYTRSRYYHLYLNGMYWGLFQTQERSEARFAADYLGGNTGDYDVVKVNTEDWDYKIEVTDGTMDSWSRIWDMVQDGFSDNADYFELLGRNAEGNPVAGGKVLVDIDNLIDYMLSIFYTGNFDAPTSSFGGNRGPNNFFAIYSREDFSAGYTFYNHDAEHSLFAEVVSPGTGLNEDRVNLSMGVSGFYAFHPQWLHHKLSENAEYRMRFMDRASMYLDGKGILTPEANEARLSKRASEIDVAIIAESARWGDAYSANPLTRDDHWIPEVNRIKEDFFPYRTNILITQLDNAGLYSTLKAPVFYKDSDIIDNAEMTVSAPADIRVVNSNSSGTIWYTTDGTDPRLLGGIANPLAQSGGSGEVLLGFGGSAVLRVRIQNGDEWSAVKEMRIIAEEEDYSNLVITELHYHPKELVVAGDTTQAKDMEFIEFKNTGDNAIHLGGLILDSAVYHEFPMGTVLPSKQFYVVASKPSAFYKRYGLIASGNYSKNLSNGGEEILLSDSKGTPLMHFVFQDTIPWPPQADGEGFSLVSTVHDPDGNPADYRYWRASTYIGGSPFKNDPLPTVKQPVYANQPDILLYPNPTSGLLYVQWPDGSIPVESTIQLYSLNGSLLYQTELYNEQQISIGHLNLSSGVYLVKITTGVLIFRKKIVYR